MRNGITLPLLAAVALAVLAPLSQAAAQLPTEQHQILVIDASGSMTATRTDGTTRFATALVKARDAVNMPLALTRYFAIWRFEGTTYTRVQAFADATTTLATLSKVKVGTGVTPLAATLCDAIDELRVFRQGVNAVKVLNLFSDGEENSSPTTSQCYGPSSTSGDPYNPTASSWQWKVRNKIRTGNPNNTTQPQPGQFPFVLDVTVFDGYINLRGESNAVREEGAVNEDAATASAPVNSYAAFMQNLSAQTGGTFTGIGDNQPAPVVGDTNGDYCVNGVDYNTVMANYGQPVPPANPAADLNKDRVVDYYDYTLVVNNQGKGTCRPLPLDGRE